MKDVPVSFPGHELVSAGLADLRAGRESESSLLVAMAAPRLRALGFNVPEGGVSGPRTVSMNCFLRPMRGLTADTTRWSHERGFRQDLDDVGKMIESGLVEPARLRELYAAIEPELYRYPALDPSVFRQKVDAALDSCHELGVDRSGRTPAGLTPTSSAISSHFQ